MSHRTPSGPLEASKDADTGFSRPLRTFGLDIIAYGVMGGLSRSANFILLPILTRCFSPEEYGVVDIIATLSSLLAVLVSLNLESAVARLWFESGREEDQPALVTSVMTLVTMTGLGILGLASFLAPRLARVLLHDASLGSYITLGVASGALSALATVPQIVLRMQRRIATYNIVSSVQTFAYLLLALALVIHWHAGVRGVFVAQILAGLLTVLVGVTQISSYIRAALSWARLRSALAYSLPLLPANAAAWLNAQADRVILLSFMGLGAVGVFGAASRLVMVISLLVGVVQQAWVPVSIRMIDEHVGRSAFYRRTLNYYAAAMFGVALLLTALAKELLALLVPFEYQAGYVVVPWLAGAQVLNGSGAFTNVGMLISKRTGGNSVASWVGAVINVGVCLALIPRVGIHGAAIGSFLAALAFTCLLWWFSVSVTEVRFDTYALLTALICYVSGSVIVLLAYSRLDRELSLILRLVTVVVAFGITAYATLWRPIHPIPAG